MLLELVEDFHPLGRVGLGLALLQQAVELAFLLLGVVLYGWREYVAWIDAMASSRAWLWAFPNGSLSVPVAMLLWFAPALVALNGIAPVEALKASWRGSLKNIVPFLIYGVVLFILAIVASLPFMLGWLTLGPVMAASIYTSYRDIYFQ